MGEAEEYIEGAVQRVSVNRYERDPKARAKAIAHYGLRCQACRFDFETAYGVLGEGFIHIHHTVPLSKLGKSSVVDPINDLRPVCPNCHAMLHKRVPPFTIEELRDIMEAANPGVHRPFASDAADATRERASEAWQGRPEWKPAQARARSR